MSLGGRLNYVAQPSDQQVGNNAYQPLPQFTGDDPYSQIMAMMPAFRNPYANASSGNALGGFDPSIYARNYSSGGGGGGGDGGGGNISSVGDGLIGDNPTPAMPSPDEDFPPTYVQPMPSPDEDFPPTYVQPMPSPDEDFPPTYVQPMPEDQYPYPSEPMPESMVMPYEPAEYNYDQPAPEPMATQEPMAMPYEPAEYNYDQPTYIEPAGGDFRGEMGGGNFGRGLEDTGEDSFDSAGYAKGGMVNGLLGPNPKGPDDGAAFLDRGEYVIKKSSVKKYGRGLLDMINEGKVPAKKIKSLLD